MLKRPANDEFAPYYLPYMKAVPEGDIISTLGQQLEDTKLLLKNVSEEQGLFRYGEGKWSIKEVIGHMTDTERVMAYRLLCIARGETVSLPGFDEKQYTAHATFNEQSMEELIDHFSIVRESTLALMKSFDDASWKRKGLANNTEVTVRGVAYIIAGHAIHHCQIIKERYLQSKDFPVS